MVLAGIVTLVSSCKSMPDKAQPVKNFDAKKYMGTWYEIARFDFRFEKNLNNVSAQYRFDDKGRVVVLNSGYNTLKKQWSKADGLAKFRGAKDEAALKVSFFGPFYSGYNVIALDDAYQYALIAGKDLNYLWILSRTKNIPDHIKENYLELAQHLGYDTSKLLWITHDRTDNPYLNEK